MLDEGNFGVEVALKWKELSYVFTPYPAIRLYEY